eukprot:scaffold35051_cov65-Phaeocystis_antarctica.AAC.3
MSRGRWTSGSDELGSLPNGLTSRAAAICSLRTPPSARLCWYAAGLSGWPIGAASRARGVECTHLVARRTGPDRARREHRISRSADQCSRLERRQLRQRGGAAWCICARVRGTALIAWRQRRQGRGSGKGRTSDAPLQPRGSPCACPIRLVWVRTLQAHVVVKLQQVSTTRGEVNRRSHTFALPFGLFANQSGASSSSSHVRGHLPAADGERAHETVALLALGSTRDHSPK